MKKLAIIASAVTIANLLQGATGKCYGLVLGSGDESAAYQAGVI